MKKIIGNIAVLVVVLLGVSLVSACNVPTDASISEDESIIGVVGKVSAIDDSDDGTFRAYVITDTVITNEEKEGLLFMREEEKLARDVYITLYEIYGMKVFANISRSESTHMEAIKFYMDTYGIEDPVKDNEVGEFENEELQDLYDQLIEKGKTSLTEALIVGATIEEVDIIDLQEYIDASQNEAIIIMYKNLMKGSRNHLRAFVRNLERKAGVTYEPQYLDLDVYTEIINSPNERGRIN